ncbi:Uncharacterized protein dnm_051040 [Desulfonema magnum]|uniref:Uncharacterized protein n=1 Tax=Desulfonema magnum TaxID=45655 RepID=A0A975BP22_9BACT|nr:Uncharacterized protein dnm_051040 [Desulfonema magnum]
MPIRGKLTLCAAYKYHEGTKARSLTKALSVSFCVFVALFSNLYIL